MTRKYKGPCSFGPCDRQAQVKGLCATHYNQWHAGRPLTPIRIRRDFKSPAPGKRICTTCERMLDEATEFYKRSDSTGYQSRCKECAKAYQIKYQREKKEREAAV